MKKVEEYLKHARECREMARTASNPHRVYLVQMAETWEQLADARIKKLNREGRVAEGDDAMD
jgi:hypothetical protein